MIESPKILVVEDQRNERHALTRLLQAEGYKVVPAENAEQALAHRDAPVDLVISDLRLGATDGLMLLRQWKEIRPQTPFVMMTAFAEVPTAVDAMKAGAADYLTKPVNPDELLLLVKRTLEHARRDSSLKAMADRLDRQCGFDRIVRASAVMEGVLERARRAAQSDSLVLLLGESGVGKELIAEAIHQFSPRRLRPFVVVNMAAIPPDLVESELFGHRRGAFTGAVNDRDGRFVAADGGTLFVDEIGDLALSSQAKLLRALENLCVTPVGADDLRGVDARIVAATSRDLPAMVADGRFREDLFYRLNVVTIRLPPLRERREDIAPLIAHFLRESRERNRTPDLTIDAELARFLENHDWPGNVRQLRNTIESMVVMSSRDVLTMEDLPALAREASVERSAPPFEQEVALDRLERSAVLAALQRCDGNRTRAAELLGISVRTLQRRLKSWGINSSGESMALQPSSS